VAYVVARRNHHLLTFQLAGDKLSDGLPKGVVTATVLNFFDPLDLVQPASADDPDSAP